MVFGALGSQEQQQKSLEQKWTLVMFLHCSLTEVRQGATENSAWNALNVTSIKTEQQ